MQIYFKKINSLYSQKYEWTEIWKKNCVQLWSQIFHERMLNDKIGEGENEQECQVWFQIQITCSVN